MEQWSIAAEDYVLSLFQSAYHRVNEWNIRKYGGDPAKMASFNPLIIASMNGTDSLKSCIAKLKQCFNPLIIASMNGTEQVATRICACGWFQSAYHRVNEWNDEKF